jgi:hypothetical protein
MYLPKHHLEPQDRACELQADVALSLQLTIYLYTSP